MTSKSQEVSNKDAAYIAVAANEAFNSPVLSFCLKASLVELPDVVETKISKIFSSAFFFTPADKCISK